MKRLTLFLIITLALLAACNKTEKLTSDAWHLYSTYQDSADYETRILYTLENSPWSLKFNPDGTIDVSENGIEKWSKIHWEWKEKGKSMYMAYGGKTGTWLTRFDGDQLIITIFEGNSLNVTVNTYKRVDGEWYDAGTVDELNKIY